MPLDQLSAPRATEIQHLDLCPGDGLPCYAGQTPEDEHFRCGTVQCGRVLGRPEDIRAHVDEAARCLFRSMEAESSMVRTHFVRMAARLLFAAAALADGDERRTLSRYFGQAQALAVFFYGDGRGVSRLLDELRAMTGARA